MKSKRGITLVSLVVTIIVLIILAVVSINLTLGENGIITMAKRARENMELAKEDEERQLNELYMQMEQEGLSGETSYDAIAKLVEFKRQIASAITDMGIQTAENADASTMSSNIRSLTGASSADKVSYDNTNSKLVATNVQGAIDELNNNLGNGENSMTINEKLDYLMTKSNYNITTIFKDCISGETDNLSYTVAETGVYLFIATNYRHTTGHTMLSNGSIKHNGNSIVDIIEKNMYEANAYKEEVSVFELSCTAGDTIQMTQTANNPMLVVFKIR